MNIVRGTINRIRFAFTKNGLKKHGRKVLFESPYEIEGKKYISVENNIRIKPRLHMSAISEHNGLRFNPEIKIGSNVSINYDVHIACINKVAIGNGCLLASKVFITDHFHGDSSQQSMSIPPNERRLTSKGPVVLEENVWVGENVAIMPGVTIGRNSIIGANSVVTKDIPPYSVAVGAPARVIKTWNEEVEGWKE